MLENLDERKRKGIVSSVQKLVVGLAAAREYMGDDAIVELERFSRTVPFSERVTDSHINQRKLWEGLTMEYAKEYIRYLFKVILLLIINI